MKELEEIIKRKDIRSADRATMREFLRKLKKGEELNYQQRQNLWAYISRYTIGQRRSSRS